MIRQLRFKLLLLAIVSSMTAGSLGSTHLAQAQPTEGLSTEESSTGNVTIEVNALRNQEGNVCLKLFDNSEGFPNDDESALQKTCVPIEAATGVAPDTDASESESVSEPVSEPVPTISASPSFRYTFENLAYGNYAVAIYHDRNSNERLNRGLFGIPEEGYGFSNDAPANLGPADFDDAVFAVESADITIPIRMRYP